MNITDKAQVLLRAAQLDARDKVRSSDYATKDLHAMAEELGIPEKHLNTALLELFHSEDHLIDESGGIVSSADAGTAPSEALERDSARKVKRPRGPVMTFIRAYIKSMRPYYSFVTGIAGWIGVAFYQFIASLPDGSYIGTSNVMKTVETPTPDEKKLVILAILFLSWGVNQIFNDYLGMEEDRINAPDRPMVSGELNPAGALAMSVFLLIVSFAITWLYLEPMAMIPLAAGVLLNIVYEYSKAWGVMANVIFGIMICMCTLFGFYASGPMDTYMTFSRFAALAVVATMNGLMTFYTYFKDYEGDKAAGKKTIIVRYGIERARTLAIFLCLLPSILFLVAYFELGVIPLNPPNTFWVLGILTMFIQIWTGVLYYTNPVGEMTYYSLSTNFRACTCGQAAMIALFEPELGLMLFLFSYMFVGFLFNLHSNAKS